MTAPKLTALGVVLDVGGGKVFVDGPDVVPGEDALGMPATLEEQQAWASLLMKDGAVRITIEPADASATALRPAEEIAREMVSEPMSVAIGGNTEWAVEIGQGDGRERVFFLTKDCSFYGADNIRAIIAAAIDRDRASRSQQPRDLAGRIRALIQEYAGRWSDTDADDTLTRVAIQEIMRVARLALADAHAGVSPVSRVGHMRDEAIGSLRDLVLRAADELETIIRECAPEAP